MLGRTDRRERSLLLMVVLAVFAIAASLRLADWQINRAPDLRQKAAAQMQRPAEIPTVRGRILDRNGRVLALTGYRDQLVVHPKLLVNSDQEVTEQVRAGVLQSLTDILGLSADDQARVKTQLADGTSEYAIIDRQLTEAQSAAVKAALALPEKERTLWAAGLEPQPVRMYPNEGGEPGTTLASHLLGFVNSSGHGAYGIEEQYDAALAGLPTRVAAARDHAGRLLGSSATIIEQGQDGVDIHLTVDAGLQLQLEKELYAAWSADKSKRASGLIMDPDTGDILAWASVPGYDANDYAAEWRRNPSIFIDPIATSIYEPGSVMKMFTAAAALDAKTVTLSKRVLDSRSLSFPPFIIRNADHKSMGWIPFRDVIAYSRNVATARTASHLARNVPRSSAVLYRMWTRLGIGRPTGVDLAYEAPGLVRDPATTVWQPVELANRSFGQGVSVTQVQLAAGYTPMINGGYRVTPHFLSSVDGQPAYEPTRERVLSPQLSGQLHSVLDHVTSAVPWYARGALIPGYQVGGKTGTAQIWQQDKQQYSDNVFNFSFVGYVGGDKPEAVVTVRIEEAHVKSASQGDIKMNLKSYELFNRVAKGIIDTLQIRKASMDGAGYPEPLSQADQENTPDRYAEHVKLKRKGVDLLGPIYDRYLTGGPRPEVPADPTGTTPTDPAKETRTVTTGGHQGVAADDGTTPGTGKHGHPRKGATGATGDATDGTTPDQTSPDPSVSPGA